MAALADKVYPRVAPTRQNLRHGMLGQSRNRQRRVNARVGWHRGTITNQQVLVAKNAQAVIDDAVSGIAADDGS